MNVRPAGDSENWTGLTPTVERSKRRNRAFTTEIARAATMFLWGFALSSCQSPGGYPDPKDVAAITEAKPRPSENILTDPDADARYNSALEGWGDRLHAAGLRLCRFYQRTGMPKVSCEQ